MLLAVDVGNTQTHLGAFDGDRYVESWRFQTRAGMTGDELAERISAFMRLSGLEFDAFETVIVSSVVPPLGAQYELMAERYLSGPTTFLEVGPGIRTGMPIRIDNPYEVGADRLVNAVAAYERYGAPCVVVDFGTGINFDAVSGAGEYLGGAIAPGVEISLTALTQRGARIPRIDLAEPATAIGKSTRTAIQSGVVYGFAGLIDGIARRIEHELGEGVPFLATGGLASRIAPLCETIDAIDDHLTLTGLRLIAERNRDD
ncbi:type III pantothenate kinase [Thermoleophilia bacterium SCSIO 60948]|nr:type III pantothenate kinase [Thermoleophilia bacterium SCSIO 60948]